MKAKISKTLLNSKKATPKEKPFEIRDTEKSGFLLRVQPSGAMSYYFEHKRGERYLIGTTKKYTPQQARDKVDAYIKSLIKGDDPTKGKKSKDPTLAHYLKEIYGPEFKATRKTGVATIKRLESRFPTFLKKRLTEITTERVKQWRKKRLEVDGVSNATVNRETETLRSALQSAVKEYKLIDENPLQELKKLPVDNMRVRYLSESEEIRLRDALEKRQEVYRKKRDQFNTWRKERSLPPTPSLRDVAFVDHLAPLVLLAINTGARRGELFSLRWQDVDLDLAFMTVRGATAKNNKTRHIPLNQEAMTTLLAWREQQTGDRLVFPGKDGKRLDNIQSSWEKLLALAEVENFTFHDLRHHFASKLVMVGVDLNTVRELLGHADLKMTLRYAHLAPKVKAAAVAKLAAPQNPRGQVIPIPITSK